MASINEALANHKLYRLLKRIAEGDEQAVDNLYSDYGDFIYFHILNITDNKYIAEEIFQEVFINIIMLVAAVIPHHHHPNGMICMKQDLPVEQQCPTHHHHPGNDSCCSSECMTRFYSPTPSIHTDSGPDYVFIATLFTDVIIEHLLRPQEKRIKNYYVYRDSLHGTDTHRTTSLRAPPYSVFA